MLLVGLTGGIGSGKSTVARMLEERGAVVFDADVLARAVVEPGTPVTLPSPSGSERTSWRRGELDREALASIVFADPAARRDLEAIVHPEVRRLFAEGSEAYRGRIASWCSVLRSWSRPACTRRSTSSSSSRPRRRRRSSG